MPPDPDPTYWSRLHGFGPSLTYEQWVTRREDMCYDICQTMNRYRSIFDEDQREQPIKVVVYARWSWLRRMYASFWMSWRLNHFYAQPCKFIIGNIV